MKLKHIALTYLMLWSLGLTTAMAQQTLTNTNGQTLRDQYGNQIDPSTQPDNLNDSTTVVTPPPRLYMWQLDERLGDRTIVPADTANLNFQNTNLVEGMEGHYNYLGNLGSPRQSRLFFSSPIFQ